jgi:hypothetical protein
MEKGRGKEYLKVMEKMLELTEGEKIEIKKLWE